MQNETVDKNKINASPTKALFISMLVKDIGLIRAIIDLVDNCVDGARHLRGVGELDGMWVRLEVDGNRFKIADNCGGMDIQTARQYAFRFGRPDDIPRMGHSVGQFGVGMKRALFKLGEKFEITSTCTTSRFTIRVDVPEWRRNDNWEFQFDKIEEGLTDVPQEICGTEITVTALYDGVAELFKLENFHIQLCQELQEAHLHSLNMGLAITVNGLPLTIQPLQLLQSEVLKPAFQAFTINGSERGLVNLKLYAGISERDTNAAGWYVFCNGRLLLSADQSKMTGWDDDEGMSIPKYHNDYAWFRGYAFFDADDAGLLPWNTTKTGVDLDSQRYRAARLEMKKIMHPVLTFCRKLGKDKSDIEQSDDTLLETIVKSASNTELSDIAPSAKFLAPVAQSSKPKNTQRIQYDRQIDMIDKVKRRLRVSSLREVGEKTFDYYYREECED